MQKTWPLIIEWRHKKWRHFAWRHYIIKLITLINYKIIFPSWVKIPILYVETCRRYLTICITYWLTLVLRCIHHFESDINQAEAERDGIINPQNYNFNQFSYGIFLWYLLNQKSAHYRLNTRKIILLYTIDAFGISLLPTLWRENNSKEGSFVF